MRVLFLVIVLLALPGCGPAALPAHGLDPFYKKHLDAGGLPIVSSEKVPDAGLLEAQAIVVRMTSKRADVLEAMIARKTRVADHGEDRGHHRQPRAPRPEHRVSANRLEPALPRRGRDARADLVVDAVRGLRRQIGTEPS